MLSVKPGLGSVLLLGERSQESFSEANPDCDVVKWPSVPAFWEAIGIFLV